jgi:hypothetical protein
VLVPHGVTDANTVYSDHLYAPVALFDVPKSRAVLGAIPLEVHRNVRNVYQVTPWRLPPPRGSLRNVCNGCNVSIVCNICDVCIVCNICDVCNVCDICNVCNVHQEAQPSARGACIPRHSSTSDRAMKPLSHETAAQQARNASERVQALMEHLTGSARPGARTVLRDSPERRDVRAAGSPPPRSGGYCGGPSLLLGAPPCSYAQLELALLTPAQRLKLQRAPPSTARTASSVSTFCAAPFTDRLPPNTGAATARSRVGY